MIAVLGGYGEVGKAVVRALLALRSEPLRIGGRDPVSAEAFARTLDQGPVEVVTVDINDAGSLERFVHGCTVLVNCAGPSHRIGEGPALTALRAGADYLDVAGDERLHARLDDRAWREQGRRALLSAGLQPGLTALLPLWLAHTGFDRVTSLTSYFGLRDLFTAVAAEDYRQSVEDGIGRPRAAWRNGGVRPGVLIRKNGVGLPFFPGPVTVMPYLNQEAERVAAALELEHGDWYTALADGPMRSVFDRLHTCSREDACMQLQRMSRLDLAGRAPFVTLLLRMTGHREGKERTCSLALRGHRNADLTGALAAVAVDALARVDVPAGRHFAAMVLDPGAAVETLLATGMTAGLSVIEGPLEALNEAEEGVL